ncbi:MAG: hypothetical protein PHT69_11305 [Bacteroidales bacterium]|nr:hypothetical protein [Bacteroidales bacterium]
MKDRISYILTNRNIIMIAALNLGILWGKYASHISFLSLPILSFMMTVSLIFFDFKFIFKSRDAIKYTIQGIFLNYILSGIVLMGLAYLIIPYNKEIYLGFLFIVFAPPGVVIVPFATLFKGDINHAATGVITGNLILILLFPLMIFFISTGNQSISPLSILKLLLILIVIPLIISRFFRNKKTLPLASKYRGPLINWSFFLIIYIVIGLNQHVMLYETKTLLLPMLVFAIYLFLCTFLLNVFLKFMNVSAPLRTSQTLMFAVKNNGFSAVVSLSLIGAQAAIPSAALSIVLLLYLIYFSFVNSKNQNL